MARGEMQYFTSVNRAGLLSNQGTTVSVAAGAEKNSCMKESTKARIFKGR
jgi:hypothetical protein